MYPKHIACRDGINTIKHICCHDELAETERLCDVKGEF
jgi:hypothetical protein